MTEQIYTESLRKIMNDKSKLEKAFNVALSEKEKIIFIEGEPENELLCMQAIEAVNLGFTIPQSLSLKEEGMVFEKIYIKKLTNRKNLSQIRARIIGTNRKSLDTIEGLTDCIIAVHNNTVGIIGKFSDIEKAIYAVKRIIAGSEHATIYAYLEEQKALEKQSF